MTLVMVDDPPAATGMVYDDADRSKPPNVRPFTTILADSVPPSVGMGLPRNSCQYRTLVSRHDAASVSCSASLSRTSANRRASMNGSSDAHVSRIHVTYWTPIW